MKDGDSYCFPFDCSCATNVTTARAPSYASDDVDLSIPSHMRQTTLIMSYSSQLHCTMHIRAAPSLIVSIVNLSPRVAVHAVASTWFVEAIVPVAIL